jgi:hypothetical protein
MVRASLVVVALFVSAGLVACAGTDGSAAKTADAPEATSADVTASHLYDCSTGSDQDQLKRFELSLSPTSAEITDISKSAAVPDSGKIDPSYRPTPQFAGSIRYRGFDKLTSSFDEVSELDLIIPKEFQASPQQGKILIRESGPEGGGSTSYFCKTKTKKLAVDLSVESRFACSLSLECTNDNPPGQTCVDSTFIQQTDAHKATMKTKFLDHFGVHVEERQVDDGPSTKFERTSTKFSATFGDGEVELTYRAGITYLGKVKLSNGKTATAQCNDLSMLDE